MRVSHIVKEDLYFYSSFALTFHRDLISIPKVCIVKVSVPGRICKRESLTYRLFAVVDW